MDIKQEFINQVLQFEGETEINGQNRSPFIDKINDWMPNAEIGDPYCITGICYTLHLLEVKHKIKFDLPRNPGTIEFFDQTKKKYKTKSFAVGNIVIWIDNTYGGGHASIILETPKDDGSFKVFEFNVVVKNKAGVFKTTRNIHGDEDLSLYGIVYITNAWKSI